jgi:hypothetical protein
MSPKGMLEKFVEANKNRTVEEVAEDLEQLLLSITMHVAIKSREDTLKEIAEKVQDDPISNGGTKLH